MSKHFIAMTLAVIAGATCAEAAQAAPRNAATDGATSVVVSYADLNLQRDADVQTLLGRLSAAARGVCGAFDQGQKGADAHHRYVACRRTAMEGGVAAIASAKVSAAYAAQTSGQLVLADRRP